MKLSNLKNNAMFLSCWYERSRPVHVTCISIFITSILALSFLTVSMEKQREADLFNSFFNIIVVVQGLVLLLQGTIFAWTMGARERISDTLDFHRNSPQSVWDKMVGLVFGSTWYEWTVFFILFLIEVFIFVPLSVTSLKTLVLFNGSLILTGLLLHSSAVTIALLSSGRRKWTTPIMIVFGLWFIGPFVTYASTEASPFFAHLLGLTAFKFVFPKEYANITGWFFTLDLPVFVMQVIVQVPLLILMMRGMYRIFYKPNSPAWSKADVIRWCCFILFMVTGFSVAQFVHFGEIFLQQDPYRYNHWGYYGDPIKIFCQSQIWLFTMVYIMMGVIASVFIMPTYFKTVKYAVLHARGLIKREPLLDDGATGIFAIMVYMLLAGFFFVFYFIGMQGEPLLGVFFFILISSYVTGFSGLLEYFRISKFRGNKILFVTVLLVMWVFIPWMAHIIYNFQNEEAIIVTSVTPFVGAGYAVSVLFNEKALKWGSLLLPWGAALVIWTRALLERNIVEKARQIK